MDCSVSRRIKRRPTQAQAAICAALAVLLSSLTPARAQQAHQFLNALTVNSGTSQETVTVPIQASGTIANVLVVTGGVSSADFTSVDNGTCAAGDHYVANSTATCSLTVQFQPKAAGQRLGAVVLVDTNGAVMSTQPLYGVGNGPVNVFTPATINTVGGNGQWIYKSGDDNIPATASPLFLPAGVAVDPVGNLFIADSSNNRIRRIDAVSGLITTIAGDGTPGYANDGKAATVAEVSNPANVLLDGAGNLYIADSGNHAIRELVLATGKLITVVGQLGVQGSTGDGGLAAAALLNAPEGLAFDAAGNLYIADTGNNVIRRVDAVKHVITTYAGTLGIAGFSGDGGSAGAATLNTPWGLATDPGGALYIADLNNSRIRKVSSAGVISTIAGTASTNSSSTGLPATSTNLKNPAAVLVDVAGNLYIADAGHDLVLKVNATTGLVSTAAGNAAQTFGGDLGPATRAGIYGPYALALDSQGNLYVADIFHNRIREVLNAQATLIFSALHVATASAPQNQIVENDGNASLLWSGFTPDADALVNTPGNTCSISTPVLSDATCLVSAEFYPQVIGNPITGTIQFASSAVGSPGVLTLSGQSTALSATTTAVSSSANPVTLNTALTLNATVTGAKPTGAVQFYDGSLLLGSATLNGDFVATFLTSSLTLGSHSITAVYGGDASNATSTSPAFPQAIIQAAAVALTSSVNPTNVGASTSLTATVKGVTSVPTGNIIFSDGGVTIGTVALNASGVAVLPITSLAAGAHTIVAAYVGDTNTSSAKSTSLTQTVIGWKSATVVTSSASPSSFGSGVTLTVAVTSGSGVIPSGTVVLQDGSTNLGTLTLNAHGVATYSSSSLSVGTHSVTATFSGDATNAAGVSPAFSQVVQKISTTAVLTSSLNPSSAGASIQLTAKITPASTNSLAGALAGTVIFSEGAITLGTGTLSASGVASASLSNLAVGSYTILATYQGSDSYAASVSTALTQTVQAAATTVQLTSSTNPSIVGNSVFFTAIVSGSGGIPSGTVTFLDGSTVLGQGTLSANGQVTFSSTTLAAGSHAITASYSGDKNDAVTSSSVLTQVVQQTRTAITLVSGSNPAVAGVPITYAATISSNGGIPSGNLQLMEGTTVLATTAISSTGAAQFSVLTLSAGSHTLLAHFGGDANDSAASSSALIQVVQLGTANSSLTASASPSAVGSSVVFTAKVTGTGIQPTGTVTFLDGSNPIGTGVLTAGVATFSISSLTLGSHIITATYPGDTTHSASTPATLTEVVQQTRTAVTLVSSNNPAVAGVATTYAATISSDGGIPSGQLQLMEGTNVLATSAISATGAAQFQLSTLSAGSHTLVASFAGNTNYGTSTSSALIQVVQLATSTTSLSSSANPSAVGSPLVFTAKVTGTGNQPSGTITFLDGTTSLGTGVLTAGVATLSAPSLSMGSHSITANYAGDTTHGASAPAVLTQLVQQLTTTTLASSANPSIIGSSITLTATVKGTSSTAPTGTVSFYDGSTLLGSPVITGGVATLNVPNLAAGPHLLLAKYAGDANSFASDSASVTQVVNAAGTTVSLSASSNPAMTGTAVVFSAAVGSNGSAATGTVTFMDGAAVLGTITVASQAATLSVSSLAAGQHAIVARYSGDSVNLGSTSTVLLEVVQQHTTTTLTSSVNPLLTAQPFTLTATVTGANPSGTVTFMNGSTVLGQVVANAGSATFAVPFLPSGMGVLTAVYSGDSYNLPSTSAAVNEAVSMRPSATSMTASSQTYASGDQVTLVAIIQVTGPVAPTGIVTFTANGQAIGTANVAAAGAATLTFAPSAANYSITATYSGDSVYLPSTATPYSISQGSSSTFSLLSNPASVTMASGDHTTLNLTLSSTAQFADTLSLACLDLPADATCTFAANQVKLTAGGTVSAQLVLDTGLPLGAGPRASLECSRRSTVIEAAMGIPALLLLMTVFTRAGQRNRRRLGALLSLVVLLCGGLGLTGCGSSLNVSSTPTGTYNIRVLATGNITRLTQTANVTLKVQ